MLTRLFKLGLLLLAGWLLPGNVFVLESFGAEPVQPRPLVFVITGESNSGGVGRNKSATEKERMPRACVQIMNLTDGKFRFENMQLGVNNLRDHFGLEKYYSLYHGFENELANAVEAGAFPGRKQVYLIKTGHGGSRIAQWEKEASSGYWKKFVQRIDAAKRQLPGNPEWVVLFSLGINDALAKTPVDRWKTQTRAHLKKIRTELPGCLIVMTRFESMGFPRYNAAIAEIAKEEPGVFSVSSKGAELVDIYHWSYSGLKTVTQRMVSIIQKEIDS